MADLLNDDEIETALASVPQWTRNSDEISRTVEAPAFLDAIAIVDDVARTAETAGHHPDIDIRYTRVTFTLSTHSEGGLTSNDFDLAARIDEIAARASATATD